MLSQHTLRPSMSSLSSAHVENIGVPRICKITLRLEMHASNVKQQIKVNASKKIKAKIENKKKSTASCIIKPCLLGLVLSKFTSV